MANLHEDMYNGTKQGKVWEINNTLEGIESKKTRNASVRARVKWSNVGHKCSAESFNAVKPRHKLVFAELHDNHGRSFTKTKEVDQICHSFYIQLYKHKDICEGAMREVFEGFTLLFNEAMNEMLT